MRKLRALVIGPTPPPIGGDTVSTRRLLESGYWAEYGLEPVHVDTSPGSGLRLVDEPLALRDILRGIGIFLRVLWKLFSVDVVLVWANSRFICTVGIPIVSAAHLWRRPIVVKIFGALLMERIRALPAPWRRCVIGMLGRADLVLPQTAGMAEEIVDELGLSRERVVCLPNFIPGEIPSEGEIRERQFRGRCVFVGQVKREKGVFDIIDALAEQRDFTCDMYGPVLERDRDTFFAKIENAESVRYRGIARPEEVRRLIGDYDLLLLPSYHTGEGYPAVILEAFATAVPVVATDWKSIPDLVADGSRGILVPVRSPGAIREALHRISQDEVLYRLMSQNAARYVGSFSERAVVRDILMERVRGLIDRSGI